jgi:ubiquinone/menaquinone biosynthesis C-methylase UbiE
VKNVTRTWRDIWAQRALDPDRGSVLAQLIAADGYDTGFGTITEDAWRQYVAGVIERLGIEAGDSLFDVGCGGGAFLLPAYDAGHAVGGLDYSEALLASARDVMPKMHTQLGEAAALDVEPRFDAVVSCGVFFYFADLAYAQRVLERMVRKARKAVAILDVPDTACQAAALAIRRGDMTEDEYRARYDGLEHLYFERRWFEDALAALGVTDVRIESQFIADYANAAYRFNVVARL